MAKLVNAHFVTTFESSYNLRVTVADWQWSDANGRMGRLYDVSGTLAYRGSLATSDASWSPSDGVSPLVLSAGQEDLIVKGLTYSKLAAFLTQPRSVLQLPRGARCVSCELMVQSDDPFRYPSLIRFLANDLICKDAMAFVRCRLDSQKSLFAC